MSTSGTRTAIDIVWNDKKKIYQLVQVDYNYMSKKTEVRRLEPLSDNEHMALYKAKEIIVKKIFALKDNVGNRVNTFDEVPGEEEDI